MMKLQLVLFIILTVIQIGYLIRKGNRDLNSARNPRIVGGAKVNSIEDYPFVSALIISSGHKNLLHCGSVIFADHWALTAGHCVRHFLVDEALHNETLFIRANTTKWKEFGGDDHHVVNAYMHDLYFKETHFDYDIALLRVREPFRRASQIKIVPHNFEYRAGLDVIVLGWGTTIKNAHGCPQEDLQFAEIKIQDWDRCNGYHHEQLTQRMVCAGLVGKDACNYDSGGPLIYKDKSKNRMFLIGLVSFGKDGMCGVSEYTGVYTNVAVTSDWIREVVRGQSRTQIVDVEDMEKDDIPYKLADGR